MTKNVDLKIHDNKISLNLWDVRKKISQISQSNIRTSFSQKLMYMKDEKITEILNDRWTILLLREAFYGVTKFNDFLVNTGISKQILSNRLKHLIELEIFELFNKIRC